MKKNWFYRKSSIKKMWAGMIIVLAATIIAEQFVSLHPHFRIDSLFAFHAIYGFFACILMVILAKLLGYLIKRKEDYYDL